jgi:hypothetical protein
MIMETKEIEDLRAENTALRAEIERLKAWNKAFYGRVHYYFNTLEEWKAAEKYSTRKNQLTTKCRALEEQINKELKRIDRITTNRRVDTPADADKPLAVQTELKMD